MSISGADRTLLETHPHVVKFYLVVHQPETALACRVNGAPSGDPTTTLTFDTVTSGAFGNVEAGQTLLIGSAAGLHDRGIVRVRSATATVLTIAESSDLRVVLDNDYLTILYEHRFWLKNPLIVSLTEMYEDYDVAYVDEDTAFSPVPMMEPSAFIFKGVGAASVDYDFSASHPIAGASVTAWASTYQHGDGGAAATITHTETYSVATGMSGTETKLVVTDSNGKTATGWRYDFILDHSSNAPITDFFTNQPVDKSWENGVEELQFTLYGSAGQTVIRDGAQVWIIFESWYGDTEKEISLDYTERANILFNGWVVKDSVAYNSDHNTTTFTARPTDKMLGEGKAFPATLELNSSPSIWTEVSSCTTVKAALYLLKWRSTLLEITDVHVPTGTETAGQDWGTGTLKDQITEALDADFMSLVQHKTGMFWIEKNVDMLPTTSRGTLDLTMIMSPKHWIPPVTLPEDVIALTNYVFLEGVAANGGDGFPYFSEAPGLAAKYRGQDGGSTTQLAVVDQDHLNQLSGDLLAAGNKTLPDFSIMPAGFWPLFDVVPQRRIRVAIASTNRGVNISGSNFIVRGVRITPDFVSGTARTELKLAEETDGGDGMTVEYTLEPPTNGPPPPPPHDPPIPPPYIEGDGGRRMLATNKGVVVCNNILAASIRWHLVNSGLSTANDLRVRSIRRDPFHWWTTGGSERTLWAGTDTGIWKMTSFPMGTWSNIVTLAAINTAVGQAYTYIRYCRMDFSIEDEDRFAFVFYYPGGIGAHRYWFTTVKDGAIVNTWCPGAWNYTMGWPDIKYAKHSAWQTIWGSEPHRDSGTGSHLHKTVNGGANWALIDVSEGAGASGVRTGDYTTISVPYLDAANPDRYVLWGDEEFNHRISTNGGAVFSYDIDGGVGMAKLGTGGHPNHIWLLSERPDGEGGNPPCRWSNDRGVSWTDLPLIPAAIACMASHVVWDGSTLKSALIGGTPTAGAPGTVRVYYWGGGASWVDKTGNLEDLGVTAIYDMDRDSMGAA